MSETPATAWRVLLVFDYAADLEAMLDAATRMAAGAPGGILGVFLEDADLLNLAELPFATEVALSAVPRPLQREGIEREWQALAEEARLLLARFAEPDGLPWTFKVVRGRLGAQILDAPAEIELVWVRRSRAPLPAAEVEALPVLTLFEDTAEDRRSLLGADDLAWSLGSDLLVLLPGGDAQARRVRRETAGALLRRVEPRRIHYEAVEDAAPETLAARVRQLGGGHLVLAWNRVRDEKALERLARQRGALLLVR